MDKLKGIIPEEKIVLAAADPNEKTYIIQSPDGTEREELRKPPQMIEPLQEKILNILLLTRQPWKRLKKC